MAYLSFEDVTQAPPGKPAKVEADSGYLSFDDVVGGTPPPQSFGEKQLESIKRAGRDVVVAADMLAGFPAFLSGWMAKSTLAGGMAVTGESKPFTEARKIVEGTIAESPTLQAASHPIARILGVDVKNSGLGELFAKVDEVTNEWAAKGKDEEAQSLRSHLVETLMALIPTAAKHGSAGVKTALKKKAPIEESTAMPEEPPEVIPEEPPAAKAPFETYATPGAAAKAAKAAAKAAKLKEEQAAVQTGPANYTHTDGTVHEVEITGAPKKVSGMSMTPIRVGEIDTWVPTKQVELAKVPEPGIETPAQIAERLAQAEAERIPSERVAEAAAAPIEEQIRLREQRQAEEEQAWVQHGEQMKAEAEQTARSAEEQKAFEAEQARQDRMEAGYGEPSMRAKQAGWQKQKGEVDPALLATIAAAGGLAAYTAANPQFAETLGGMALIGTVGVKGKGIASALAPILKGSRYTSEVFNRLPANLYEVPKARIREVLQQQGISKADKEVFEKIIAEHPEDKISAVDLVGKFQLATSAYVLKPAQTLAYSTVGLRDLGLSSDVLNTARSTVWNLPEHIRPDPASIKHFRKHPNQFGHTRSFMREGQKHVVEVQSDPAQFAKPPKPALTDLYAALREHLIDTYGWTREEAEADPYTEADLQIYKNELSAPSETYALLGPTLKHWPRRLIREELMDSAKKGESSVRFASPETMAKVEGWPQSGAPRRRVNTPTAGLLFQHKAAQSVYDKYQKEIVPYLQKLGGTLSKDEAGNTWYEVPTPQIGPVKMFGHADPELLAKIALTGGVAAYLATHPEDADKVGLLGAGVLATKGKIDFKSLNESALISHAREGHQEAFTELYKRTAPQARRFIASFERQGVPIEDVLQRTYEKLATVLQRAPDEVGGFAGKSSIQTFINTMARNRAVNMLEYEGNRPTESLDITSPEGTTLGETLGHETTPEVTLQQQQLQVHLQEALDKIDPNFRESFELREMEGKSYEEIAEIRGIPVGTVRSQISRAKDQLKKNLRDYVNPESGMITPDMQAAMIASGLGGLVGAYMNREDSPLKGALIGVAGVAAAIAGLGKMGPAIMRGTTKLAEIYPPFRRSLRDMEVKSMQEVEKASAKIHDFLEATKKLPPALATQLKRAHLYGDAEALKEVLNKDPALAKGYQKVRAFLDETQKTLQQMGRFSKGLTDYLPLMVKDYTGLVEALGREDKIDLQKVMDKAEKKSQELRGKPLSDVERSIVVAKWISKAPSTQGLPGFAKERTVRMQDKLMPFYHTLEDSLIHYAHASVDDIATATFFGTDLKVALKEGKTYTDINKSIQAMVDRGLREGKLTKESAAEMQQILRARFVEGRLAPGKLLQDFRNVAGLLTLGQIGSGLVQTTESLFSVYHHGLVPTIQAVGLLARGKSIAPKEFGLAEHVIEENLGRTTTGKALGLVLKANLLKTMDQLGMRQNLTASFIKNKMLVRSPKGLEELRTKWGADYAEDFPQLVKELQSATLDKRTPLVDSLLFQELSDIRPASRIENPKLFNKHPNLRFMWQLKQYMLTMADVLYRDSYQKLKSSDPKVVAAGVKNLALYGTSLALASVPPDAIKNWLFGRGLQLDKIDYVDNIARNFGLSRYDISKVEQSQKPFVTAYETLAGTVTPPIASVTKSLAEGVATPEKLVAMVPVAGRIVYNRELGGNIAHQRAVDKAELTALRAKILSKNPQLQKQLELVQEMAKTSNPAIGGARERLHNMPAYQALQEQLKRQKQQQAKGVR